MIESFKNDIAHSLNVLRSGGLILYPTDTIWGIGCDATNSAAIEKVYQLKKRPDNKALILLCKDDIMLKNYVPNAQEEIFTYLKTVSQPTTVIYNDPEGLPKNFLQEGNTVAIRIPNDPFCHQLLQLFEKPIISTSANISGMYFSGLYSDIHEEIKNGVDYIVQHRNSEKNVGKPSSIIRMNEKGAIEKIR